MTSRFSAKYLRSKHIRALPAVSPVMDESSLSDQLDEIANLASGLGSGSVRESDRTMIPAREEHVENIQAESLISDESTIDLQHECGFEETTGEDANQVQILANDESFTTDRVTDDDEAMITGMVNVEGDITVGVPYSDTYPDLESAAPQVNDHALPLVDIPTTTSNNYFKIIRRAIRCYFNDPVDDSNRGDRQPLLPIHAGPNGNDDAGPIETERPPYSNCIIDFIWDYVLSESMRQYFMTHQNLVIFLVILAIVLILVITYFTGTFPFLVLYFKIVFCWLASIFYEDSPTFRAICGR